VYFVSQRETRHCVN